jgi:hypothetical protein
MLLRQSSVESPAAAWLIWTSSVSSVNWSPSMALKTRPLTLPATATHLCVPWTSIATTSCAFGTVKPTPLTPRKKLPFSLIVVSVAPVTAGVWTSTICRSKTNETVPETRPKRSTVTVPLACRTAPVKVWNGVAAPKIDQSNAGVVPEPWLSESERLFAVRTRPGTPEKLALFSVPLIAIQRRVSDVETGETKPRSSVPLWSEKPMLPGMPTNAFVTVSERSVTLYVLSCCVVSEKSTVARRKPNALSVTLPVAPKNPVV